MLWLQQVQCSAGAAGSCQVLGGQQAANAQPDLLWKARAHTLGFFLGLDDRYIFSGYVPKSQNRSRKADVGTANIIEVLNT